MNEKLTDPSGRAYGWKAGQIDPVLALVGPGSAGGELLRRYWQPIALSSEATTLPKQIRRLGEDLILFRTGAGEVGLLYPRCMHRGTSLLYGRVEQDGIRCCYHGWKFDNQGHCLDQPCEPEGGRHRKRIRQPWYPVQEQFGAIWAYMGPPDKQPLFPIFSCFENLAGDEFIQAEYFSARGEIQPFPMDHNWYQTYDNCADHYHVPILHSRISGNQFPDPRISADIPEISWEYDKDRRSILTISKRYLKDRDETWVRIEQGLIPNMLALPPFVGDGPSPTVTVFVPWDDTHFAVMDINRQRKDTQIYPHGHEEGKPGFGPDNRLWGEMDFEYHQRNPLDYEAQNSQGTISLHSEEHLVSSDTGVGMHRRLFKQQCDVVANGGDPVGVAFKEEDRRVHIAANSWMAKGSDLKRSA
jgi:phenylpropionate dioxygenase-like ring-hydroxylating dioxygenase large terminal subunit